MKFTTMQILQMYSYSLTVQEENSRSQSNISYIALNQTCSYESIRQTRGWYGWVSQVDIGRMWPYNNLN